jgi:hypothetical protein
MSPGFLFEQHYGNQIEIYEGDAEMRRWIHAFWEVWDEAQLELRDCKGKVTTASRISSSSSTRLRAESLWS